MREFMLLRHADRSTVGERAMSHALHFEEGIARWAPHSPQNPHRLPGPSAGTSDLKAAAVCPFRTSPFTLAKLGLLSRLLAKSAHVGRELDPRLLEDRCCSKDQVNLGQFLCRELAAVDGGQNTRGELVG